MQQHSQPSAGALAQPEPKDGNLQPLWATQTENAGNTKGLIWNLHIAAYPCNSSLLKKELHEKGELKQAAARWEI